MTGNLFTKIQIPVRPQVPTQQTASQSVLNTYTYNAQDVFSKFEYPAAVPLSQPRTTPKGIVEDSPKGRLIKENFFQSMKSTVKSYGDYCKYFYNAGFKGTGTDYSVGKINDLAIRVGSLGIAITLASSKFFPFARGMEFVGLGTWFAAMAAWPKILALPVKAKTGLDPTLKYEDSQGRRKSFFEDRQYLCFDLFKHIDKDGNYNLKAPEYELFDNIGDKLGIPRNIPNRREAIQNKIAQYSVQYNALMMLTAGVMTPVLSSLVADQLQVPLGTALEKTRIAYTGKNITDLSNKMESLLARNDIDVDAAAETLGTRFDSELSEIIKNYKSRTSADLPIYITPKEEDKLIKLLGNRYYGTGFGTGILKEMQTESVISKNAIPINHNLGVDVKNISENIAANLQEIQIEKIRTILDEVEQNYKKLNAGAVIDDSTKVSDLISSLQSSKKAKTFRIKSLISSASGFSDMTVQELKNAINTKDLDKLKLENYRISAALTEQEIWHALDDVKAIMNNFDRVFTPTGQKFAISQLQIELANKLRKNNVPEAEIEKLNEIFASEISKYFDKHVGTLVRVGQLEKMFKIAEINLQIKDKIDSYKAATIKDIAESVTARSWDKIPKKYFKIIGFTKDELNKLAGIDTVKAAEIISQKFSELVKNEEKLNQAVSMMSKYAGEAVTKEQKAFVALVGTSNSPGLIKQAETLTQRLLEQNSFTDELKSGFSRYFISNIKSVKQKVINTIDSLGKPIQILDIFKSLKNVDIVDKIENGNVVGDKLVNPDAVPHIVKDFLGTDSDEFVRKMQEDMNGAKKYYTFHQGYDEPGAYRKAVNSLVDYIKDIALQKNDISDWITKFEGQPDGYTKGIKHSKHMVGTLADTIFAHFSPEIRAAIEKGSNGLSDIFEKNKTQMKRRFLGADSVIVLHSNFKNYDANYVASDEFCRLVDNFFNTTNATEAENLGSKLIKLIEGRRIKNLNDKEIVDAKNSITGYILHLKTGSTFVKSKDCLDSVKDIYNFNNSINMTKLINNLFNSNDVNYVKTAKDRLILLLEDRATELGAKKDFQDVLNTINGYISHLETGSAFDKQGCTEPFYRILNAKTANKDIGEMAGKNTVDFMLRAAQNIRSRNKWQLLVWSLFAATVGISVVTIANMGHTNSFNPDHWKKSENGDKK